MSLFDATVPKMVVTRITYAVLNKYDLVKWLQHSYFKISMVSSTVDFLLSAQPFDDFLIRAGLT